MSINNATIYDVAREADVSLATVSRVINNPEKVKKETKDKVLKVIEALGYKPNQVAKGLASKKTTTVGILVSDVTRASVADMIGGILDIAKRYKYKIRLFTIDEDDDYLDVYSEIVAAQIEGVLVLHDELNVKQINDLKNTFENYHIPYVFVNMYTNDKDIPLVTVDYQKASYDLTKHLLSLGRKDIYLLSSVRRYSVNEQKELGYMKAMNEAGYTPKILRTSAQVHINKAHFEEFFREKKVDAAIGVRDSIAVSFQNVALDNNRKIPGDLLVAGFQNTKYSLLSHPTLTTIDIPVYDLGAVSMRLLTKILKNGKEVNQVIILPHQIIYRNSTKISAIEDKK